ncbi:hypothetical protein E3O25_13585 [Cryobacterium sp. TMT1-3]|uniref:hypothetical protein n=1 Tax=Cryobacterium sp. TMT1-3 TaxID=1259237 RepID=UPI00106A4BAC|nr:hypothetical protein [Cryobacterium sp. TMT1-3]TFC25613.1 hypothetical protein E3O25_13585 [Cryobacterium sp. TMT1-3]
MRELDARLSDGTPLPLLGMGENVDLSVAMLAHALQTQGIPIGSSLERVLRLIAGPASIAPFPGDVADDLAQSGSFRGEQFWRPDDLDPVVSNLVRDLGHGFLLSCLLPSDRAGVRQILKVSFHWRIEPAEGGYFTLALHRLRASLRFASRSIELPMTAASDASSYHLEFQTPDGLDCSRLELPSGGRVESPGMLDASGQPVAHVHATYAHPPTGTARILLKVSRSGLSANATLSTFLTATIMWLAILLPGAKTALIDSADGAAALILAAPALLIGLTAGQRESALAAWGLGPLRFIILSCSMGLFAVAGSVVGVLHEPWSTALWWTVASAASLFLFLLLVGRIRP